MIWWVQVIIDTLNLIVHYVIIDSLYFIIIVPMITLSIVYLIMMIILIMMCMIVMSVNAKLLRIWSMTPHFDLTVHWWSVPVTEHMLILLDCSYWLPIIWDTVLCHSPILLDNKVTALTLIFIVIVLDMHNRFIAIINIWIHFFVLLVIILMIIITLVYRWLFPWCPEIFLMQVSATHFMGRIWCDIAAPKTSN